MDMTDPSADATNDGLYTPTLNRTITFGVQSPLQIVDARLRSLNFPIDALPHHLDTASWNEIREEYDMNAAEFCHCENGL
jgi:hypothetical protein